MTLRILSFGAGVQSTDMLERSLSGEYPRLDAVIFADTGWEPSGVYETADRMERRCVAAGIAFYRVNGGNIYTDTTGETIARGGRGDGTFASMPLHLRTPKTIKNPTGTGMLRRQCTNEYKITPIRAKIREIGATRKDPAELWMGITWDENQRIRDSDVQYIVNVYPFCKWYRKDYGFDNTTPLVRRTDCIERFRVRGEVAPEKSACDGCPFQENSRWREKKKDPETWRKIVLLDASVRNLKRIDGEAFLHRSLMPIDLVDFEEDDSQLGLGFDNECTGYCGI